jgi:hypothetical protein
MISDIQKKYYNCIYKNNAIQKTHTKKVRQKRRQTIATTDKKTKEEKGEIFFRKDSLSQVLFN